MRLALVVAACAVLAGCATKQIFWEKQGSTQQDFYTDAGQCRAQAGAIPGAPLRQIVFVYESCMAGKGWYQVER